MPSFLQKLFRRKTSPSTATSQSAVVATPVARAESLSPAAPVRSPQEQGQMPQVAVARLSLLPILQKLPEELQGQIVKFPSAEATIALPLSTIQKQLAGGSVKMSLASLYRQSPAGTFSQARIEDKRMVEVPLAEVLRHVQPDALRRRTDQRRMDLPRSAPQLFGDRKNPYAITPREVEDVEDEAQKEEIPPSRAELVKVPKPISPASLPPLQMPKPEEIRSVEPVVSTPDTFTGIVAVPVAAVSEGWPLSIQESLAEGQDLQLHVPAILLSAGLARGKVVFRWSQLKSWLQPALEDLAPEMDSAELSLPLKVMAPAFLAASKRRTPRQQVELDETIPSLFNGASEPEPLHSSLEDEPVVAEPIAPTEIPQTAPAAATLAFKLEEPGAPQASIDSEDTEGKASAPLAFKLAEDKPSAIDSQSQAVEIPEDPEPSPSVLVEGAQNPQQIVDTMVAEHGAAGAIVALKEGLVVASRLPDHIKGDTVAAFLPQIFARLNNYTQEMQVGNVEDVLLSVGGAHFQGYQVGEIFFAVLGKVGEPLPWEPMRRALQHLQAQTS